MIEFTQEYICNMIGKLNQKCSHELNLLKIDFQFFPKKFYTITYAEALEYLNQCGLDLKWAQTHEFPAVAGSLFAKRFNGFFWILDQPDEQKWFFVKGVQQDGRKVCRDFQLWHSFRPRLAEGSERVIDYNEAVQRILERGLKPAFFEHYLRALKHGIPPFTGMGLGVERFLMLLLNISNTREVILFPRDPNILVP